MLQFERSRHLSFCIYIGGGVSLVRSSDHCALVIAGGSRQDAITEKLEKKHTPAKEKAGVPAICANGYENVLPFILLFITSRRG